MKLSHLEFIPFPYTDLNIGNVIRGIGEMPSLRSAGICITGVSKHAHIISSVGEPLDKI
jgi:hypothetical protein